MKKAMTVLASVIILGLGMSGARAQPINRLSAEWFKFDGTEFATDQTAVGVPGVPDGAGFYLKTVTPSSTQNVLYVTLSAVGDIAAPGGSTWLSCRIFFTPQPAAFPSGVPCRTNSAASFNGAPNGYISIMTTSPADVDETDNAVPYQWCVSILDQLVPLGYRRGSPLTVVLRFATSVAGNSVFLEQGHVYIDSSAISLAGNRCVQAAVTSPFAPAGNWAQTVTKDTKKK
jgi:hypothetical protein